MAFSPPAAWGGGVEFAGWCVLTRSRSTFPREGRGNDVARCVGLAGESPAAVSAGAPRSRLHPEGEIPRDVRSVESPTGALRLPGGKQSRRPSMKRTLQPREMCHRKVGWPSRSFRGEGNRLHLDTGWMQGTPGVERRACGDSPTRNRRGPPRPPTSGKDPVYKPTAKGSGAGRESEGSIVLRLRGQPAGWEGTLLWSRLCEEVSARA
jgi:hypothetical protein